MTVQPERLSRHANPTIKAAGLSHLLWERPDLDLAERFAADFGLGVTRRSADALHLRGSGPSSYVSVIRKAPRPRFVGFAWKAADRGDLDRVARIPGASGVEKIEGPGGGERVVLRDPHGFRVEVVHGIAEVESQPFGSSAPVNHPFEARRVNDPVRPRGPAVSVARLGHLVTEVPNFRAAYGWYTAHFGLIPTDVQHLDDGSPAIVFLRLDLGATPADHHTLVLGASFAPAYNHCAYEVADLDAVGAGNARLRAGGWAHAWGIGRHLLGSQIFDYWKDPWGAKHEHYADGDLFDSEHPTGYSPAGPKTLAQWGPPLPADFIDTRMTPALLASVVRGLRRYDEVTIARLVRMKRTLGG